MLALLLVLTQSPVTVQLNHDQFTSGDRARVYVQSAQDGYLVVLHADPDGRIRVLFPLDPRDDDFIRGGKRFEVRGRADRDAFQIEPDEGSGTVLAAVAKDPFTFDSFARNDHWDFRALGGPSTSSGAGRAALAMAVLGTATRSDSGLASCIASGPAGASHTRGIGHSRRWYLPGRLPWCATSLCRCGHGLRSARGASRRASSRGHSLGARAVGAGRVSRAVVVPDGQWGTVGGIKQARRTILLPKSLDRPAPA